MDNNLISDLSVWEAMQHRLEALHADFFGAQTTNATPSEPRSLTLADVESAVHDIDPDGRFLQDARLMVACHKLNKEQVETVIGFAERLVYDRRHREEALRPRPRDRHPEDRQLGLGLCQRVCQQCQVLPNRQGNLSDKSKHQPEVESSGQRQGGQMSRGQPLYACLEQVDWAGVMKLAGNISPSARRRGRHRIILSVSDLLERRQRGETYKEIANALGCCVSTVCQSFAREVPNHAARIRTKAKRVDPRLAEILEARNRKETLKEIGDRLGVSRERIRQIIAKTDLDEATRRAVTGYIKPSKYANAPRPNFRLSSRIVNRWLAEIGWRYCSNGKHVQPLTEFSAKSYMCRTCGRERQHQIRLKNPEYFQAYARDYKKLHPEVQKKASKKYWKNHREKALKKQQKKMVEIKADPVKYENLKAYWRAHRKRQAEKLKLGANIRPADTESNA
jgi:uncharacterized protein (DUF433 family)